MGVKTHISLAELKKMFPSFSINSIKATKDGIIDTTYILNNFILKKYERDIKEKINRDTLLLKELQEHSLNVPSLKGQNGDWYLYKKLAGTTPKNIKLFHIQALARFIAKMHQVTQNIQTDENFLDNYPIDSLLTDIKKNFYFYYKKMHSLKNYSMANNGFIHGDLFTDNTLFCGKDIAVFDFIDGANGSFTFDIAVALFSFNPSKRRLYTNIFLNTYNQIAPHKISLKVLDMEQKNAAIFYGLLCLQRDKSTKKVKLLAKFW